MEFQRVEFHLLGPLRVCQAGIEMPIGASKVRTLLAALLLEANTPVPTDRLIEALWGDDPPASAAASLLNHVLRLRRRLGDTGGARIRAVAPGYLIEARPGELDSAVFVGLCAEGRAHAQNGQWAAAARSLADALALWRGSPLADVPALHQDARIQTLLEARSQAFEGRIEADLELGRHHDVIAELRALTAEHPLREVFHGQLMLALYRADRRAEALEVLQRLRRTLVDELGMEPSPSIQELHRRVLDSDPELAAPAPAGQRGPRFQLPADTRVFTGREREVEQLIELARAAPGGTDAGMVVISAIDGMAGIGKTTLAVHAAHRIRENFPDGQLFIDLHGYTTDLEPLTAGDALDWFLRSLGVPPQIIPQDLGERAAYYRDRLDGTRTLILLDNAGSAAQVRPLLPGGPGCLVLVTSRKRLAGLDDSHSLALDILPDADAVALLHRVAGPGRIPAHHPAIQELIELCGRMPLAIRITAARLRHRPALRIEDVVDQLRDETARLDQLQDEDEDRNLTAVFDLSYQHLAGAEKRVFRLLGLIPGPDFDAYAAANLAGVDHRAAERVLEVLVDHNLLIEHSSGRYQFHDLIRLYAHTLADASPAEERDTAVERLLDYYQHTARTADRFVTRHTRPAPPASATIPVAMPELSDRGGALAWMRTERENLLAYAVANAQSARAVTLTAALASLLQQEGPWSQAAGLHRAAAAAAHDLGDRLAEANALHDLARVRQSTGDLPTAIGLNQRAGALYRELGNRLGEANALLAEGRVRHMTGDRAASDLVERALAKYREMGDRFGEANALNDLGRARQGSGEAAMSVRLQEQARELYRELGDRLGEATALWDLGRLRTVAGDYAAAAELLKQSLDRYQDLGNRHGEANALHDLGRARLSTGDPECAAGLQIQALAIYRDLGSRIGEINALHDLGRARHATGDYPAAAEFLEQALAICRKLGIRAGEIEMLTSMGALTAETTGPQDALPLYQQALEIAREVNSPLDEAQALEGSARCSEQLGDRETALAGLRKAVAIYQRIGAAETAAAVAHLAALEGRALIGGGVIGNEQNQADC